MASSGSRDFDLDVAEYVEEAFERCGLEVRTGYDLQTARRSLNLLFADWANRGLNRWTISQETLTLADGDERVIAYGGDSGNDLNGSYTIGTPSGGVGTSVSYSTVTAFTANITYYVYVEFA